MTVSAVSMPHPAALRLGYLSLVPFVLGAALVWIVRSDVLPHVLAALSAFAAVVVAFLGGVHWGLGFRAEHPTPRLFGWGAAAPVIAAIAVMMPPDAGLVVHGVMLIVCYLVDRKVYPAQGASAWLTMRFRLSVVASIACFVAAAAPLSA